MTHAPTRADRRRAARTPDATPEDATNPEAPEEPETTEGEPRAVAISEVVKDYGNVVADLARDRKIPHATGVKLVEITLQYDIQRRNLALQEVSLMRDAMPGFPGGIPQGAVPVSPEEADAIQDGTHPDLQPEQE